MADLNDPLAADNFPENDERARRLRRAPGLSGGGFSAGRGTAQPVGESVAIAPSPDSAPIDQADQPEVAQQPATPRVSAFSQSTGGGARTDAPMGAARRAMDKAASGQGLTQKDARALRERRNVETQALARGEQVGSPAFIRPGQTGAPEIAQAPIGSYPRQREDAAIATDRQKANESRQIEAWRQRGIKYFRTPDGRLQPERNEAGQVAYEVSPWARVQLPNGEAALERRGATGARETKRLPITAGDDPTDPTLYWQLPDGNREPIGHVEDLAKSPNPNIAAAATKRQTKWRENARREAMAPLTQQIGVLTQEKDASEAQRADADSRLQSIYSEQDQLRTQEEQLKAAGQLEQGGVFGIGSSPTPAAQQIAARRAKLDADAAAITEAASAVSAPWINKAGERGTKAAQLAALEAEHRVWQSESKLRAYEDLAEERKSVLRKLGRSGEGDPILAQIEGIKASYGMQSAKAKQDAASIQSSPDVAAALVPNATQEPAASQATQPTQSAQPDSTSDMWRGLRVALGQTIPLTKGVVGLLGDTVEKVVGKGGAATAVKNWGINGYKDGMHQIEPLQRENDNVTEAWRKAKEGDIGALVDWVQYGLGYAAGQLGETAAISIIGGIIGSAATPAGTVAGAGAGIVAKSSVKAAATAMVERLIAGQAAKIATEMATEQAVKTGVKATAEEVASLAASSTVRKAAGKALASNTAVLANGMVQEVGSIYPDAVAKAQAEGRELSGTDLARVWGSGLAAGAIEGVTDKIGLDAVLGNNKHLRKLGRVGAAAAGGAAGVAMEGGTEAVQTAMERFGSGQEILSPEGKADIINSAAQGALGGAAIGGVSGLAHGGGGGGENGAPVATDSSLPPSAGDQGATAPISPTPIAPSAIEAGAPTAPTDESAPAIDPELQAELDAELAAQEPAPLQAATSEGAAVPPGNAEEQKTASERSIPPLAETQIADIPAEGVSEQTVPEPSLATAPAPINGAKQITDSFNHAGKAIREASQARTIERLKKGEDVRFTKPASIEVARNDPNYILRDNADGSVSVVGIKGLYEPAPTSEAETPAEVAQPKDGPATEATTQEPAGAVSAPSLESGDEGSAPAPVSPGPEAEKNLPAWARERMIQEGINPSRKFNDADLENASIQEALRHSSPESLAREGIVEREGRFVYERRPAQPAAEIPADISALTDTQLANKGKAMRMAVARKSSTPEQRAKFQATASAIQAEQDRRKPAAVKVPPVAKMSLSEFSASPDGAKPAIIRAYEDERDSLRYYSDQGDEASKVRLGDIDEYITKLKEASAPGSTSPTPAATSNQPQSASAPSAAPSSNVVAQSAEQRTPNPQVAGSTPADVASSTPEEIASLKTVRAPAKDLVLWGRKPNMAGGKWVKLSNNTSDAENARRRKEGWETYTYAKGDNPNELPAAKAPPTQPTPTNAPSQRNKPEVNQPERARTGEGGVSAEAGGGNRAGAGGQVVEEVAAPTVAKTAPVAEQPAAQPKPAKAPKAAKSKAQREASERIQDDIPLGHPPRKSAPTKFTLPPDLAGAKPRYGYGEKQFTVSFDSDLDKALYILAQAKGSARDADYRKLVKDATGMDDADISLAASIVRDEIKAQAKTGESGSTLTIPALHSPEDFKRQVRESLTDEGEGMPTPAVRTELDSWRKANPKAPENIRVINDPALMRGGRGVRGLYQGGRLTLNAAYLNSPAEVQSVLNHEWAHDTLATPQGKGALAAFATREIPKVQMDAIREKYSQREGESNPDYRLRLVEEWVSANAEKNPTVWRKIIESVRGFLSRAGLVTLTNEETARAMLRTLRKADGADYQLAGDQRAMASLEPESKVDDALDALSRSDLEDDEVFSRPLPSQDDPKLNFVETVGSGRNGAMEIYVRGEGVKDYGPHEFFFYDFDNNPIGFARLTKNPKQASISMVALTEDARGYGRGKAFYKYLIDNLGLEVKSDKEITDSTAALYRSLIRDGYGARVDADGRVVLSGKPADASLTPAQVKQTETQATPTAGESLADVRAKWDARGIKHAISEKGDVITVSDIRVPADQRGKGIGSAAMRELTAYADATGKTIALTPSIDFGASSVARLKDFYKRLGFVENKGPSKDFTISESMIREPASVRESIADKPRPVPDKPGRYFASTIESWRDAGTQLDQTEFNREAQAESRAEALKAIADLGEAKALAQAIDQNSPMRPTIRSAVAVELVPKLYGMSQNPNLSPEQREQARKAANRASEQFAGKNTELGRAISYLATINKFSKDGVLAAANEANDDNFTRFFKTEGEATTNQLADELTKINEEGTGAAVDGAKKPVADLPLTKKQKPLVDAAKPEGKKTLTKEELADALKKAKREWTKQINDLIKAHWKDVDAMGRTLAQKLVDDAGLTDMQAAEVAAAAQQEFSKAVSDKKRAAVDKIGRARPDRVGSGVRNKTTADKLVEFTNLGAFDRTDMRGAVSDALKLPNRLTADQADKLARMADEAQNATEGNMRNRKLVDILAELQQLRGEDGPLNIATSIYYAHILSGYTTQMVNAISTTLNTLADTVTKLGVEEARAITGKSPLKVGQATEQALRGLFDGAGYGFTQFKSILSTGYATSAAEEAGFKLPEVTPVLETLSKAPAKTVGGKALKAYSTALRYVSRGMRAVDSVFYTAASEAYQRVTAARIAAAAESGMGRNEINNRVRQLLNITPEAFEAARAQAKSEGLSGLDAELRVGEIIRQKRGANVQAGAFDFAKEATFNQHPRGALGYIAQKVGETTRRIPALKLFVPFTNIVANVTNSSVNYSPVGIKRGVMGYTGENGVRSADERAALLTKGVAGTLGMMAVLAYGMGKDKDDEDRPRITGNGPSDAAARNQLRQTGWRPHSIKIGDTYVDYLTSPWAIPAAIVGNLTDGVYYNKLGEKEIVKRLTTVLGSMGETLTNMSFLQGIADLFDTVRGNKSPTDFAQNVVASAVTPNLVRQIDRSFDPTIRDPQGIVGTLGQSVPGIRQTLPARVDVTGQPIESAPWWRFGRGSTQDQMWEAISKKQAWIPEPKTVKIGDQEFKRGDPEFRAYTIERGQRIERRLRAATTALARMTKEQAEDFVNNVANQESQRAKATITRTTTTITR